jgi:hypothetical protein
MLENSFFHAIKHVDSLDQILSSGAILSTRNLYGTNIALSRLYGSNGIDYISVAKIVEGTFPKRGDDNYYAWWHWISYDISIIIDDKIDAIKTLCTYDLFGKAELPEGYSVLSTRSVRYSALRDEWHVKDIIKSKHFVGIGVPLSQYINLKGNHNYPDYFRNLYINELVKLKEILRKNNVDLPIYDPIELKPICLEESIQKYKKY